MNVDLAVVVGVVRSYKMNAAAVYVLRCFRMNFSCCCHC